MDIKLPHSLLKEFLDTSARPEQIAKSLSLCGPTVDRITSYKNDHLYHIEVITNRIDSASAFGIAREAAAILPQFKYKAKIKNDPYQLNLKQLGDLPKNSPLNLQILDNSLIPRFTAIALTNTQVKPSPKPVQDWLNLSGLRPLNNVIDITNELTLKYGQPVHAFDLDKIANQQIIMRESKKGESITTLDGRVHHLQGGDIVIQDGSGRLIDLCGIMGGQSSAIDSNTKNVLLFVQTYEPKHIRKTSLYTQERTLAAQIFEKRPDPELVLPTIIAGVKLLEQRANAIISSNLIDLYPDPAKNKTINLDLNWLNQFAGISLKPTQVSSILKKLGFTSKSITSQVLRVTVPSWRHHDINLTQDLAEEIIRIHGYFRLPSNLPPTTIPNTQTNPLLHHEYQARTYLSNLGFTEIYNLSLVSQDLFRQTNLKLEPKLKLSNPLSGEFEYLRTSLIPSLLSNLDANRGKATPPLRLFELAHTYHSTKSALPDETSTLSFITYGLDFFTTKGYLEALAKHLHLNLKFKPLVKKTPPFITKHSASVYYHNHHLGTLGIISPEVTSRFNLNQTVVCADLNFAKLSLQINPILNFKTIPQYPSIYEDLTLTSTKPVADLISKLEKAHPLITSVEYLTSHQHNHTFRLEFNDPKGNLTQAKVTQIKNNLKS